MQFKIVSNIPVPERRTKYPFCNMRKGDSFSFPEHYRNRVQSAAVKFKQKMDGMFDYCIRKEDEMNYRLWRV